MVLHLVLKYMLTTFLLTRSIMSSCCVLFFSGCGFFLAATRLLVNQVAFWHQRLFERLFCCGGAHFLHTVYVEVC
jgi:hypothetical protein